MSADPPGVAGGAPVPAALLQSLHPLDRVPPRPIADADRSTRDSAAARPAAVLVGLLPRPRGLNLLLTRRDPRLREHGGQVCFPGGRIDPGDAGPVAAALREAAEEVGLADHQALPLGFLDPLHTLSNFEVWPVVARLHPAFVGVAASPEVSDIFELPLEIALDPGHCRRVEAEFGGRLRVWHEIEHGGRRIWGVTAAILVNLRIRMEMAGSLPEPGGRHGEVR